MHIGSGDSSLYPTQRDSNHQNAGFKGGGTVSFDCSLSQTGLYDQLLIMEHRDNLLKQSLQERMPPGFHPLLQREIELVSCFKVFLQRIDKMEQDIKELKDDNEKLEYELYVLKRAIPEKTIPLMIKDMSERAEKFGFDVDYLRDRLADRLDKSEYREFNERYYKRKYKSNVWCLDFLRKLKGSKPDACFWKTVEFHAPARNTLKDYLWSNQAANDSARIRSTGQEVAPPNSRADSVHPSKQPNTTAVEKSASKTEPVNLPRPNTSSNLLYASSNAGQHSPQPVQRPNSDSVDHKATAETAQKQLTQQRTHSDPGQQEVHGDCGAVAPKPLEDLLRQMESDSKADESSRLDFEALKRLDLPLSSPPPQRLSEKGSSGCDSLGNRKSFDTNLSDEIEKKLQENSNFSSGTSQRLPESGQSSYSSLINVESVPALCNLSSEAQYVGVTGASNVSISSDTSLKNGEYRLFDEP